MRSGEAAHRAKTSPKKRPRHHSYDESVDEPAKLLEQEAVEIEQETPSEDTEFGRKGRIGQSRYP